MPVGLLGCRKKSISVTFILTLEGLYGALILINENTDMRSIHLFVYSTIDLTFDYRRRPHNMILICISSRSFMSFIEMNVKSRIARSLKRARHSQSLSSCQLLNLQVKVPSQCLIFRKHLNPKVFDLNASNAKVSCAFIAMYFDLQV